MVKQRPFFVDWSEQRDSSVEILTMKTIQFCAAVVTFTLCTQLFAAPMVVNGDFEGENEFAVWPGYTGGDNPENIPGWIGSGGNGLNPVSSDHESPAPFRDNGNNDSTVAFLQGESSIEQTVTGLVVGNEYTLSLDFNSRNCCGDFPVATVLIGGEVVASSTDLPFPDGGVIPVGDGEPWYHADIDFTASAESTLLRIETVSSAGGDSTLVLDNISIIPEPSTGLLAFFAFLGLAAIRRRK